MSTENEINKIFENLLELENITLDLNKSIEELSESHSNLQSSGTESHDELIANLSEMQSSLSTSMSHTEELIANILHPDRRSEEHTSELQSH